MTLPPSDGGINRLIALRDFGEGQATRKLKELRMKRCRWTWYARSCGSRHHAFWFSFVGSDPTRIQFLDSTGPRIIPSYVNRGLCAPGLARPSRA